MTDWLKLHPKHSHRWAAGIASPMLQCTVCGLQVPRNAAGLDGNMTELPHLVYLPGNVSEAQAEEAKTAIRQAHPDTDKGVAT